jgi:DNA polymerase-3 subunit alpha
MARLDFVHLHVHSSYSLLEAARIQARGSRAREGDRQPALALTDYRQRLFGGA